MYNSRVFIALGTNLPRNEHNLADSLKLALKALRNEGLYLRALSRFWRSPAFPPGSGPDYVNACAEITGPDAPAAVLAALHRIEARLGRERGARWGARVIDLDLLAAGEAVMPDAETEARWRLLPLEAQMRETPETLILPHPRLADRAFVLIPLAEIAPLWRHPVTGKRVCDMLDRLDAAQKAALQPFSLSAAGFPDLSRGDEATK